MCHAASGGVVRYERCTLARSVLAPAPGVGGGGGSGGDGGDGGGGGGGDRAGRGISLRGAGGGGGGVESREASAVAAADPLLHRMLQTAGFGVQG